MSGECDSCGDHALECHCYFCEFIDHLLDCMSEPISKYPEWINIKDRLPECAGHYLTSYDFTGIIEKGEFDGKNRWHTPFGNPTHWMPLPKPPKE